MDGDMKLALAENFWDEMGLGELDEMHTRTFMRAAPYFLAQQFAYSRTWLTNIKSLTKLDDYTVVFENNFVESLFPYSLSYVMMVSQCRAKELNYDWAQ